MRVAVFGLSGWPSVAFQRLDARFGGLPGSPLFATPILNYPEVAILGIGRIDLQARVVDNQVVPRQCVGISFTFDHRILDGEATGRFMSVLKRFIEQPLQLLLTLH